MCPCLTQGSPGCCGSKGAACFLSAYRWGWSAGWLVCWEREEEGRGGQRAGEFLMFMIPSNGYLLQISICLPPYGNEESTETRQGDRLEMFLTTPRP